MPEPGAQDAVQGRLHWPLFRNAWITVFRVHLGYLHIHNEYVGVCEHGIHLRLSTWWRWHRTILLATPVFCCTVSQEVRVESSTRVCLPV